MASFAMPVASADERLPVALWITAIGRASQKQQAHERGKPLECPSLASPSPRRLYRYLE